MAYTFFDGGLATTESKIWFFSAGLALLFNSFINILLLKVSDNLVKRLTVTANAGLLLFVAFMSLIIPEVQVFVLVIVLIGVLICSWLLPVHPKAA
ncbi:MULTISPECIES: hypothetical protein [Sphingobacterium]|uniref:hypothetical protein n=1 Tax=Sphingobacterium TaxID=28453 RepID=UPI002244152D|nr:MULTISPECIES: hypothetical protein [Sphingobacterium]MCW8311199.1 hypothetical protein [Sphingobacterium sp. InxBP1]